MSAQPLGGAVCRGYVGPRRSVDSLRELVQLSPAGLLADSLLLELVGRCGAEGAELRHLPGRAHVWHRRCGAAEP